MSVPAPSQAGTNTVSHAGTRASAQEVARAGAAALNGHTGNGGQPVRMGFLLSRYPAVSHTFFLHEIAGLRGLGFHIDTASINEPDRPLDKLPAAEADEARSTFYLKQRKGAAAVAVLRIALSHPGALWRGMRAVRQLPGLAMRARLQWLFYLAEALLVGDWMQRKTIHHLHVHFGGPVASVGMLTSMAWRVPYSLTIHGPEELLNTERHHLAEKLRQASFVFCISDFCRSQLCAITPPRDWGKYTVVRLGIDPDTLLPAPSAGAASGLLHLVCTGRLVPEKGQRILLEAVGALRSRGVRLHVTLIGSGVEEPALRGYVRRYGLEDMVTFTGALPHHETLAQVREADIFVLPSFAEGVPVALMEAMAFAVPCISTTVAGIPELIESGRSGLLVPPANGRELAEAIAMLAENPALRRQLGDAGRERVLRCYNLPVNHRLLARKFAALVTESEPEAIAA